MSPKEQQNDLLMHIKTISFLNDDKFVLALATFYN
jgi:hypothetical protein